MNKVKCWLLVVTAALFLCAGTACPGSGPHGGRGVEVASGRVCPTCKGAGEYVCSRCNGRGSVREPYFGGTQICSSCAGRGRKICETCYGTGRVYPERQRTRPDAQTCAKLRGEYEECVEAARVAATRTDEMMVTCGQYKRMLSDCY